VKIKDDNLINWDLLMRHMQDSISEEEEKRFNEWLSEDTKHEAYYKKMVTEWLNDSLYERNLPRLVSNFDALINIYKNNIEMLLLPKLLVGVLWQLY
jgi:hypothetical protein